MTPICNQRCAAIAMGLVVTAGLSACADSMVTAPAPATPPWQEAAAHAVRASGLQGLVGVQLVATGTGVLPVRLVGAEQQVVEVELANRLFAEALANASEKPVGSGPRFSVSDMAAAGGRFTVAPAGTGATPTTYTYTLAWGCADESTGGVWTPTAVRIAGWATTAVSNSGGHLHSAASKPRGAWTPTSGVTSGDGSWTSQFTAPEFSGEEELRYTVTGISRCTGTATVNESYTIAIPGLAPLGSGTNYSLVGQTGTHPASHYGTPAFNNALRMLAGRFHEKYNSGLAYNDMSLATGGRFDVGANWRGSHAEHRVGKNVDMRTRDLTRAQLKFVQIEWSKLGGSVHDETGTAHPHYHLRF